MKPARITDDQWRVARIQWESEPTASYAQIAENLGVSKAAVGKASKKQGWQKRLSAGVAAEQARAIADSKLKHSTAATPEQTPLVDANRAEIKPGLPAVPPGVSEAEARAAVAADAVDRRAGIELKHRREHDYARALLYGAIKSKQWEDARTAKTAIEGMKLLHDLERRSWRLDTDDELGKTGNVQIVVNRKAGVKIGR